MPQSQTLYITVLQAPNGQFLSARSTSRYLAYCYLPKGFSLIRVMRIIETHKTCRVQEVYFDRLSKDN